MDVSPWRIPAHYRETVEKQIQQGVIEESCSPWMAPAVFIPKKSVEICLCIDYRELNKCTVKDAYSLPLVDEVQRLFGFFYPRPSEWIVEVASLPSECSENCLLSWSWHGIIPI